MTNARRFLGPVVPVAPVVPVVLLILFTAALSASGPTFRPDVVFRGSSLAGWAPLGQADWRAENGQITGTPRQPDGGWLMLEASYQDVALFANVTCTGGCRSGVLLRAERTANGGLKGIFVSLSDGDRGLYAVTLDAQGRETARRALAAGSVMDMAMGRAVGSAPATPPGPPAWAPPSLPSGVNLPGLASLPMGEYLPGQANAVDLTLTGAAVMVRFNGGSLLSAAGAADDDAGTYGRVALFVGGTGQARFTSLAYADLNARPFEDEKTSPNFRVRRLSEFFYSYSATTADVNRDGHMDVVAGPYYYPGPGFAVGRQIYSGITYNPTSEYPLASMVNLASDFTGDGWPDVLVMSGNAGNGTGTLYVNPRGENRRWDAHVVIQPVGNEETLLKDIDGDGRPEVIHSGNNTLRFSRPNPANPTGAWTTTTISEPGPWGVNVGHGMGIGDVNGDGLADYVNAYGWWQQPARGDNQALWTWHPVAFARWGASQGGPGGAEMGVYDVNGDGLNDVVTALEGHGFGLAWHEQKRDASGRISFVQHAIMDGFLDPAAGGVVFTQPHATAFADMNQDGVLDLVVGKRHHSHFQYTDPDNWGMPVVYVYNVIRTPKAPGGAEFVPELVHNRSGVGSHLGIGDLDGNGTPDIATSGASGTFVFFNHTGRPSPQ
jgi:hypothetical protein